METPSRPAFAARFPADAELDKLVDAFERGDYRAVRAAAPGLADTHANEEVRAAARELVARTSPDPLAKWLFVLTALLLVILTAWWTHISHLPRTTPSPPLIEHPR